uniref:Uncharacterized protein n=1 Tax=Mimivirus LCMiAC01 TaxID=2506608 RepID=A0A481YZZ1_9VIRU|nr:MAG: hypothetical protein LCMiAC01_05040 [Mimivirus LCMiAC01]
MGPIEFKNLMFDRVFYGGERFNLAENMSDIISFTIVSPWTANLRKLASRLEGYRAHIWKDDLRIIHSRSKVVDNKTIFLYGMTELGTIYEIKLIPSLLYQWAQWYKKYGAMKPEYAKQMYSKYVKMQEQMDRDFPAIR